MTKKNYLSDKRENADLIRCASFILEMIKKYGPEVMTERNTKVNEEKAG